MAEAKVNEWVKTLVTSGVVAGVVSWLAASYKIEQEFHIKQAEAGYEALVKANTLFWQWEGLTEAAKQEKDEMRARTLAIEAQKLKRQSDASYIVARQKISAFGDESVVKALSDYYSTGMETCHDRKLRKLDVQTYRAIRNTLGVGGNVTDEQLAVMIFLCTLR